MAPKDPRRKENVAPKRKEQSVNSTQNEKTVERKRSKKQISVYTVAQTNTVDVTEGVGETSAVQIAPVTAETRKRKRQISQGRVLKKAKDEIKNPKQEKSERTASKERDVTAAVPEVSENEKVLLVTEGVDCPICLDTQETQTFVFLTCSHRFHSRCIDKWMAIKQRCPLCKTHVFASYVPTYSGRQDLVF